jgi:RND family efflux transporter MFP subunit
MALRQPRDRVQAGSREATQLPVVRVVKAGRSLSRAGLDLPGSTEPLQETAVYARANGYVRKWTADIGAHVKKGDTLAVLEVPDVDEELRQARATAAQIKAGIEQAVVQSALADKTTRRYAILGRSGLVSEQEVDQYQTASEVQRAGVTASEAAYNSAQANVHRLEHLESFGSLTSPFDGVITMRTAELGQLVVSGAAGQPLFKVAEVDVLRVFVQVPQPYAGDVRSGMKASIRVRELQERAFDGVVARTTGAIDVTSRSLRTEIDIPNAAGALLPGMYVRVALDVQSDDGALVVPSTAVLFGARGTRCAVVADGVVHWTQVEIDADLGDRLAVSGLSEGDLVAVLAGDQLGEGTRVAVRNTNE